MDHETMRLARQDIERTCAETEILDEWLELDDRQILELGCGNAELTRLIAGAGSGRRVTALEVDEIQHGRNLAITDLPNVTFLYGGAEVIAADDAHYDVVLMFKSLHHVPVEALDDAMREIHRVLVPGGLLYVSEPLFAGDFNEIVRRFHDERRVREAAFAALERAVEHGLFELVGEQFFNSPVHFDDFEAFEAGVIGVTHTRHELDATTFDEVRTLFERHMTRTGADFLQPMRVDLLRKPE